jgi:hypothetical protein
LKSGTLASLDSSIVGVLGVLATTKAVQRFGEQPEAPVPPQVPLIIQPPGQ